MANERCYRVTKGSRKVAIVLRCPDHRLIAPHKRFTQTELGLGSGHDYHSLKRGGGAMALARAEENGEDFRSIISDISTFVDMSPDLTHIIIISHEDCRKYDKIIDRAKPQTHEERADLLRAVKILSDTFPHIQIGAYYARFKGKEQKTAYFETVFETNASTSLRKSQ